MIPGCMRLVPLALKGASEEIRLRFFQNMSKRAAELLKEEMELMGAVRLREVEKGIKLSLDVSCP